MDIRSSTAATQGYATARSATKPTPQPQSGEGGFARLAREFTDTLQNGEATAKAAMTGNADPQALVQALAQTQLAVETAVTVRDKVVQAYQEILRMQV